MRTQSPDTSPEAEQVLVELLRKTPPWRRLQLATRSTASMRALSLAGLRLRHPDADDTEFRVLAARHFLGEHAEKLPGIGRQS